MRSPRLRKTDSTRFSQRQIPAFDVSVCMWVGGNVRRHEARRGSHKKGEPQEGGTTRRAKGVLRKEFGKKMERGLLVEGYS